LPLSSSTKWQRWVGFGFFVVLIVLNLWLVSISSNARSSTEATHQLSARESVAIDKINTVVAKLQQANVERNAQSKSNSLAFAVILENLAAAFNTPPAPDSSRERAVKGLCDTAAAFRTSVQAPAVACPSVEP
jgi:hypothetical protein